MGYGQSGPGDLGLAALRERPSEAVIGLDYDGTLAPIVADPAKARAHPDAAAVLRELAPLVGSVVIVTGRPAALAVELGGLHGINELVVLGQYGLERWESGVLTSPPPPPGVTEARAKLPGILEAERAPTGVWIEDKGQAVAVHTRRTADPDGAIERLRGVLEALAERTGLVAEPGRYVLELRPPGMDKGEALRTFVSELAMPVSAVLFAGDDLGDLAAYDAVEALRAEGIPGVKVCSASREVTALTERADVIVEGPGGVVRFLEGLVAQLGEA